MGLRPYRLLVLVYNTYMRHYVLKPSLLGWGAGSKTDVLYGSDVAYLLVVLLFNSTIFVITTMLKLRSVTSPQEKRWSSKITRSVLELTCASPGVLPVDLC
ncbi:uncharacterized protein ACWYII_020762 [Salvelinus alpinus]